MRPCMSPPARPIYCTSDYSLWNEGKLITFGQFADYPDQVKIYDRIDITDSLKAGENKLIITAYEPLMQACADRGIFCVLVEMPFNLAVLNMNAADGIQEKYPEIEDWYIGGHSLGGSMAASYLADKANDYEGLILLGSYSTADLSGTDLSVLSVYGSEDKVLNREKYDENKSNLPDNFTEVVIDGGCHAYFGMYGAQDGDGMPTITNKKQINLTVDAIVKLVSNNKSED